MIQCESVSFSYGKKEPTVLDRFTHRFGPGVTMLRGPSGCGKTTLLRLMAGYLAPSAGSITIDGFSGPQSIDYARRGAAFAFQEMNLLPLSSVRYNLEFVCSIAGIPQDEARRRSDALFSKLGLEQLADRKPNRLSGGQRQRASIARALVKHPRFLFLDEPTANLDDMNTAVIRRVLAELPAETVCVISSHDHRLEAICHDIIDFSRFLPVERHLQSLA